MYSLWTQGGGPLWQNPQYITCHCLLDFPRYQAETQMERKYT